MDTLFETTERSANFSADRLYRYSLRRRWLPHGKLVNWIMLNPSTADENENDPTVERCERRARAMGASGICVTNLFAFRSTDPAALPRVSNPVGEPSAILPGLTLNDRWILREAEQAGIVICGWGNGGLMGGRSKRVVKMLRRAGANLFALKLNGTGEPQHPLYLGYKVQPQPWDNPPCNCCGGLGSAKFPCPACQPACTLSVVVEPDVKGQTEGRSEYHQAPAAAVCSASC